LGLGPGFTMLIGLPPDPGRIEGVGQVVANDTYAATPSRIPSALRYTRRPS